MDPEKLRSALLIIVSVVGSFAAFTAVQRFFAPREEERSPIGDISDMEGREVSAFSKLEGSKNMWDKLDLFFARNRRAWRRNWKRPTCCWGARPAPTPQDAAP